MFLVISETAISLREETLDIKLMQQLVGIPNQPASIEFAGEEFSDPNIDLVCDDEFLYKDCSPTCITPRRKNTLHGQVLVVGLQGTATVGLTQRQIEIVKQELIVIRKVADSYFAFLAKDVWIPSNL